jgi:hypothetical protein
VAAKHAPIYTTKEQQFLARNPHLGVTTQGHQIAALTSGGFSLCRHAGA